MSMISPSMSEELARSLALERCISETSFTVAQYVHHGSESAGKRGGSETLTRL